MRYYIPMEFTDKNLTEKIHVYSYGSGNKSDIKIAITHVIPYSADVDHSTVCISLEDIPAFMNILNSVIKQSKERLS